MSEMDDDGLVKHYEDPANRRISGRPSKRRRSRPQVLSNHVPIRFSPETMMRMRAAAHQDGLTVSSWIRWIVEQELARRWPPHAQTMASTSAGATVTLARNDEPATRAAIPEVALVS
jgi:hypothetical protein